jgi:hypothetical protein
MPKQTPRPLQLGSIAKAYTDELAEHGEDAMNKRAEETMDMILERFRNTPLTLVSWADIRQQSHDTWCNDGVCHCPPPPLRQRVVAWIKRIIGRDNHA